MNANITLPRALALAIATALIFGCGKSETSNAAKTDAAAAPTAVAAKSEAKAASAKDVAVPNEDALVAEIADSLQACSYDGKPVRIGKEQRSTAAPGDCRDMVSRIMQFTGLPQNFDVVEGPVDNAAAVILLDKEKLPHRVIAFNPDFMNVVNRATGGNNWAPVSIMAHEIGHHLSGHTITPGGSQPPTELEADKFSGFVLYKMGASLGDAQKAMSTLVADGPDGKTHPGRGKRLTAIEEGWKQACAQQRGECRSAAAPTMASTANEPANPLPNQEARVTPPKTGAASSSSGSFSSGDASTSTAMTTQGNAPATTPGNGRDVLPAPGSTPSKFNHFVYDAFGVLDREERERVEKKMFALARDAGVEVVTLLVDDLHGMSANDYAYAMMRQLRVGKLDVGNGAVIVVAPEQSDVAIAIGPGLMIEAEYLMGLNIDSLKDFLGDAWSWCQKKGNCGGWTQNFFGTTERIANSGKHWEWTIRYPSLAAMQETYRSELEARSKRGGDYDPETDPTWRKIARFAGTVTNLKPAHGDNKRFVNATHEEIVGPAVLVKGDDGQEVMLYVNAQAQALMPAGKLMEGRKYGFVVREANLSNDTPQMDLLSYDQL